MSSTALKNFTEFGFGLPNGRNLPALTRTATSYGVQFSRLNLYRAGLDVDDHETGRQSVQDEDDHLVQADGLAGVNPCVIGAGGNGARFIFY